MTTQLKLRLATTSLLLSIFLCQFTTAFSQGTAFTYQGRLNDGTNPASGTYDIRAGLYTNSTGGTALYGPIVNAGVVVSNGLFTIPFDYGAVFDGTIYWMQLAVRTNGAGSFTILSPRQQLTPAPYAIFATTASNVSGTISSSSLAGTYSGAVTLSNSANQFSGAFTGNGTGLTNVNAATLGGLSAAGFWQTTGNAGTTPGVNFIGTTDNKAFDLYANNVRALRLVLRTDGLGLYTNAPNVIGGSSVNQVSTDVVGATLGGGGGNDTSGGSYPNQVTADFGTLSGGAGNSASGFASFIGGGAYNTNSALEATVSGGTLNTASREYAAIGGGVQNTVSGAAAAIGGGYQNTASSDYAVVSGGVGNTATAIGSFIGGGGYDGTTYIGNKAQSKASTIGGGLGNTIPGGALYAVIGGGANNTNSGNSATVGGGSDNTAKGDSSTVSGGFANTANGNSATVAGGIYNTATGGGATVVGGFNNTASGDYSFAGGTEAQAAHIGSFVWADNNFLNYFSSFANGFFVRCTGGARIVTAIDGSGNATAGVKLNSGDTAWSSISDRNAKKNFQPVDTVAVLNKLAAIPVERWNYKWEADTNTPHLGPMAQDFKGAFYPGRDDKSISTLEFDGVELAAIQGLNRKVEEQAQMIKAKEAQIADLEQRLARLEKMIPISTETR